MVFSRFVCEPDDTFEWVGVLREVFGIADTVISIDLHQEQKFHWDESDRHSDVIKEALDVIRPFIERVDLEGDRLEGFAADLATACGLAAKARLIDASGQLESELEGLLSPAAALGLEGEGVLAAGALKCWTTWKNADHSDGYLRTRLIWRRPIPQRDSSGPLSFR